MRPSAAPSLHLASDSRDVSADDPVKDLGGIYDNSVLMAFKDNWIATLSDPRTFAVTPPVL